MENLPEDVPRMLRERYGKYFPLSEEMVVAYENRRGTNELILTTLLWVMILLVGVPIMFAYWQSHDQNFARFLAILAVVSVIPYVRAITLMEGIREDVELFNNTIAGIDEKERARMIQSHFIESTTPELLEGCFKFEWIKYSSPLLYVRLALQLLFCIILATVQQWEFSIFLIAALALHAYYKIEAQGQIHKYLQNLLDFKNHPMHEWY